MSFELVVQDTHYIHILGKGVVMLPKPLRMLWGDLSTEEVRKFGILAGTFFWIIGNYWLLRAIKNAIFDLHVGYEWQPFAKIASLVIIVPIVLFYSKLVDLFQKTTLFYIVCTCYGLGCLFTAYFLAHPTYASLSHTSALGSMLSWIPGKFIGWFTYIFIESFGSIVPPMFWAFVSSNTSTESAKRGYGMIMSCTQFGVIVGPLVVVRYSRALTLPGLIGLSGLAILLIPLVIKIYTVVVPHDANVHPEDVNKPKTGLFEGLRLLFSKSYLLGVFVVSAIYEIISTIVEFQANMIAKTTYPTNLDGGAAFAWFDSLIAIGIGTLAVIFALTGTSFFLRTVGLRFCLIAFPVAIGITMISSFVFYLLGASMYTLMWVFFAAIVVIKGLNYALNVPAREVLYIPTSKDVRFKAKGWIDGFGNRTTKTLGSTVTGSLGGSMATLIVFGTVMSLGIVAAWAIIAMFVGNTFNALEKENKIIE